MDVDERDQVVDRHVGRALERLHPGLFGRLATGAHRLERLVACAVGVHAYDQPVGDREHVIHLAVEALAADLDEIGAAHSEQHLVALGMQLDALDVRTRASPAPDVVQDLVAVAADEV
jgi:hypothetical protein